LIQTLIDYDRILTRADYRQYPLPDLTSSHAIAFYQKRVSDDLGVKFYLDCYLYRHEDRPICIEISANFTGKSAAYQLMEHAKDEIGLASTEALFLKLWEAGNFKYTRIWGE
jgi:hypothetical protein